MAVVVEQSKFLGFDVYDILNWERSRRREEISDLYLFLVDTSV